MVLLIRSRAFLHPMFRESFDGAGSLRLGIMKPNQVGGAREHGISGVATRCITPAPGSSEMSHHLASGYTSASSSTSLSSCPKLLRDVREPLCKARSLSDFGADFGDS